MQQNLDIYDGSRRRSVYLPIVRSNVYEFFTLFDFPNASTPVGKRNETTIPTQALWLMNSPFLTRQARQIATLSLTEMNESERIRGLYLKLFARPATDNEVTMGSSFVARYKATLDNRADSNDLDAGTAYCQVLLVSNEYLYVD
jgi:hypothetical protein